MVAGGVAFCETCSGPAPPSDVEFESGRCGGGGSIHLACDFVSDQQRIELSSISEKLSLRPPRPRQMALQCSEAYLVAQREAKKVISASLTTA
jgi:hypothetical protein